MNRLYAVIVVATVTLLTSSFTAHASIENGVTGPTAGLLMFGVLICSMIYLAEKK